MVVLNPWDLFCENEVFCMEVRMAWKWQIVTSFPIIFWNHGNSRYTETNLTWILLAEVNSLQIQEHVFHMEDTSQCCTTLCWGGSELLACTYINWECLIIAKCWEIIWILEGKVIKKWSKLYNKEFYSFSKIWGFHSAECREYSLLGCEAMWFVRWTDLWMFCRNLSTCDEKHKFTNEWIACTSCIFKKVMW
jgi:hypothetical protein